MDVKLYSKIGCTRCDTLKRKLGEANIPYEENNDEEEMRQLGICYIPVLCVDGNMMNFSEAIKWLRGVV